MWPVRSRRDEALRQVGYRTRAEHARRLAARPAGWRWAGLPPDVSRAVEADAMTIFAGLGCRDLARADFRVRDGVPYFLEINPLPGLNPESSDLCYLAYRMGLTYPQLIGMILDAAAERCGLR